MKAIALAVLLLLTFPLLAEDDADIIARRKAAHVPKMSYLDNGTIKIGVDLALGGAITYLSVSGKDENVVNNWDWGRQIQMSHYSGPDPLQVPGKQPAKAWANFGWNPVQAGDHFGHASKLVDSSNDGKELSVRCVPMQWSFPDVTCECSFETRIRLEGSSARIACKLIDSRTDKMQYTAHDQELPAVYVNAPYFRLMSYTGEEPFVGKELSRIQKRPRKGDDFPWARFLATENWAAQVNDAGFGLGIYQPKCVSFLGGFAGKPGKGGTKDASTGYIAPIRQEILDHNIEYTHEYVLMLGQFEDIRKRVNELHGKPGPPVYSFERDRQGWTFVNAKDQGWPIKGAWELTSLKAETQLLGPVGFWRAEAGPTLVVEAAFSTKADRIRVYWSTFSDRSFSPDRSAALEINGDGESRKYSARLADAKGYTGGIVQLRVDTGPGESVKIKSIHFEKQR